MACAGVIIIEAIVVNLLAVNSPGKPSFLGVLAVEVYRLTTLAICFERRFELLGDLFGVAAFDLVAVEDPHDFAVFE